MAVPSAVISGPYSRLVLGNHFADDRHQLNGNFYHGSACLLKGSFVFGDSFLFCLSFVVGKNSTYSFLIPSRRKVSVCHLIV